MKNSKKQTNLSEPQVEMSTDKNCTYTPHDQHAKRLFTNEEKDVLLDDPNNSDLSF